MKKMLVMGGNDCAKEIKEFAKKHDIFLVAIGNVEDSPIKRIADQSFMTNAIDIEAMDELIKAERIDCIFPGFNERLVPIAIELAVRNDLPAYCTQKQWNLCMDKEQFKQLCLDSGIPAAKKYRLVDADTIPYPVVTKPADSCGSQGFSICRNADELKAGYDRAFPFSQKGSVIIEDYLPYDSVIIHYTAINGEIYFSGISDKRSGALCENSSVMALQRFPSKNEAEYLANINEKAIEMFKSIGIQNGPIWIEAFNNNGSFYFNEMGYRFGGSMTFHPVEYYTGVSQLDLMLENAAFGKCSAEHKIKYDNNKKRYGILPLHLHAGTVAKVEGEEDVMKSGYFYRYVPIHSEGDTVVENGTVSQVFCYLHVLFEDEDELERIIDDILAKLHVISTEGDEMLFCVLKKG